MNTGLGDEKPAILMRFTPRERRVIEGLMRAQTVKEIARDLGISYETAKDALKSIYHKAEVHSARALMLKVLDRKSPQQDWPAEALQFIHSIFPSHEAMCDEMCRLARRICPGALPLTAMIGDNWRAKLGGAVTGNAQLSAAPAIAFAARQVWSGMAAALFAGPVLPAQCPCVAAAFHIGGGEAALIVARPPRSLAFSASEMASVRLIALLAEARNRASAFATAYAANRLGRASIA